MGGGWKVEAEVEYVKQERCVFEVVLRTLPNWQTVKAINHDNWWWAHRSSGSFNVTIRVEINWIVCTAFSLRTVLGYPVDSFVSQGRKLGRRREGLIAGLGGPQGTGEFLQVIKLQFSRPVAVESGRNIASLPFGSNDVCGGRADTL
jgi:hypothetical protein